MQRTVTAAEITAGARILWDAVGPVFATVTEVTDDPRRGRRTVTVLVDAHANQYDPYHGEQTRTVDAGSALRFTIEG